MAWYNQALKRKTMPEKPGSRLFKYSIENKLDAIIHLLKDLPKNLSDSLSVMNGIAEIKAEQKINKAIEVHEEAMHKE